jgi:flagellar biosynthesis regulator FlaF
MAVMEISIIVQVQLISNRKYNSHAINDEGRRTIISIGIVMLRNEISIPH